MALPGPMLPEIQQYKVPSPGEQLNMLATAEAVKSRVDERTDQNLLGDLSQKTMAGGRPTTQQLQEWVKGIADKNPQIGAHAARIAMAFDNQTAQLNAQRQATHIEQAKGYYGLVKDMFNDAVDRKDSGSLLKLADEAEKQFPDNPFLQQGSARLRDMLSKGEFPGMQGVKEPASIDANLLKGYREQIKAKNPGMSAAQVDFEAAKMVSADKETTHVRQAEELSNIREEANQRKEQAKLDADPDNFMNRSHQEQEQLARAKIITGAEPKFQRGDKKSINGFQRFVNQLELEHGLTPGKVASIQANFKADEKSLVTTTRMLDTSDSFMSTMDNNIELLKTYVDKSSKYLKMDHGKLMNMPFREWAEKVEGSSGIKIYDMLRGSIAKENAKLQQGGVGSVAAITDAANAEAGKIYDKNMPVKEMMKLMDWTQKEGGSRIKGLEDQKEKISTRIEKLNYFGKPTKSSAGDKSESKDGPKMSFEQYSRYWSEKDPTLTDQQIKEAYEDWGKKRK